MPGGAKLLCVSRAHASSIGPDWRGRPNALGCRHSPRAIRCRWRSQQAGTRRALGICGTLQTEQPQWSVSLVDCADASLGDQLLQELFATEIEPEVALRDGKRWVRRLRHLQPKSSPVTTRPPGYALHVGQRGVVDSLEFRGRARSAPGRGEV